MNKNALKIGLGVLGLVLMLWGVVLFFSPADPSGMPARYGVMYDPLCAYGVTPDMTQDQVNSFEQECSKAYDSGVNTYLSDTTNSHHSTGVLLAGAGAVAAVLSIVLILPKVEEVK